MAGVTIKLGYAVPTGEPVEIPLKHLAVTGQTQESGKTTTLEALIHRSGLRAVAFRTKRGESAFAKARVIPPYFRERADWQFVEAILESVMRQRMRFERAWIVRATRGASTLADVRANVRRLQGKSTRGMDADIYMLLGEYLDLVVPLIEQLPAASSVGLSPGVNVMDLGAYPTEMQALVIRSVLEWIYEREGETVSILPEAWEFVPQARNSPVKLAAAQLIRKGAALRNYVWLDSQDLAGVDKEILKQVAVWLIGVQREANELRRALAHIPAGVKRPKLEDLATLGRGQFWACWHGHAVRVYVQPAWLSDDLAIQVSRGELKLDDLEKDADKNCRLLNPPPGEEPMDPKELDAKLNRLLDAVGRLVPPGAIPATIVPIPPAPPVAGDEEALYQRFKRRLLQELQAEAPALLKLLGSRPELEVQIERPTIQIDGATLRGRLAQFIVEGWFDEPKSPNAAFNELARRGHKTAKPNVYRELDKLAELGFVTKEAAGFQIASGATVRIKK